MTFQTPTSQFIQIISNNITYFQQIADEQADDLLSKERQNLHHAIFKGLQVTETVDCATDLLLTLVPSVEYWGAWQKWIPLWQRAVANHAHSRRRWHLQTQLAFFYRMDGNYETAVTLLQETLEHLNSKDDEIPFGQANFHLGYGLFYLKQYDKAQHHGQIAFTVFENNPDAAKGRAAPAQNLLGLIHLYTGKIESAIQLFKEAYHGWQQSGYSEYVLVALLNEALAFEACQKFTDAMNCYQQAIFYAGDGNNLLTKTRIYLNMGTLHIIQEKWTEARTIYLQIDRNALFQQGHIDLYTRLVTNLGHVNMELGHLETAVSHLQEAISLWRQLDDAVMLANALDSLGDTYLRLQQPDSARTYYQEGLLLVQKHPDDYIAKQLHTTFVQKLAA